MKSPEQVRQRVLEIMRAKGVTVNAIASMLTKRESAVKAWLYGQRSDVLVSTMLAVVNKLDAKIDIAWKAE